MFPSLRVRASTAVSLGGYWCEVPGKTVGRAGPCSRAEGGLERLVGPPRARSERGVDPQLELQPREADGSSLTIRSAPYG